MTEEQKKVLIDLMICCRSWEPQVCVMGNVRAGDAAHAIRTALLKCEEEATFQARVQPWLMECFGAMIAGDREERNHRFFEEATELVQSLGMTASEAHQLVDYVYGRPIGEPNQEVGGVMVTLAALCLASGLDMHEAGETELARIWTKVEAIRAKQAAKPKHSPLPEHVAPASIADTAGAKPDEQEMTALNVAIMVLKKEGILQNAYALENLRNRIAATPASSVADAQVDELRMLVQRLVHALNKASPSNDLGAKALDYLQRNGLGPSPLRESSIADAAGAKPIYQCMANDDDDNPTSRNLWMDVDEKAFDQISIRSDVRARVVYTTTPAPSVADAAGALYTMDQMRDYALAFHKARIDAALTEERYVEAASSIDRVAELCKFTDYDPDVGRVPERFTPKYMDFVRAMLVKP